MKRNHLGYRIGQDHHRAKLSDAEVIDMRSERENNLTSYAKLGKMFGCSKWTARDIVTYTTRIV